MPNLFELCIEEKKAFPWFWQKYIYHFLFWGIQKRGFELYIFVSFSNEICSRLFQMAGIYWENERLSTVFPSLLCCETQFSSSWDSSVFFLVRCYSFDIFTKRIRFLSDWRWNAEIFGPKTNTKITLSPCARRNNGRKERANGGDFSKYFQFPIPCCHIQMI